MTPLEYESFFENLATNFKAIGTSNITGKAKFIVARAYDTDANVFQKFDKSSICMLLEEYISDPFINQAGQPHVKNTGSFAIIKHFDSKKQPNEKQVKREVWEVALKIWGEMLRLQEDDPHTYNWDLTDFKLDPEGPMFDNFYGYRLEFSFTDNLTEFLEYNPEEWN